MNSLGYNILAGLAVIGAVVVITVSGEEVTATALIGLAGTIAGRGKGGA